MISETPYANAASTRKQVTMPMWAYKTLQRWSEESSNSRYTKAVLAYESLLLNSGEYSDSLSGIESDIDDTLTAKAGGQIVTALNKIKFCNLGEAETDLADHAEVADPYERAEQVNLHLPNYLAAQFKGRGLGDEIAESVKHAHAAPWNSRLQRINVKRELIEYAESGEVADPHEFTQAVMEKDTARWDVSDVADSLSDVDWWGRDDVTLEDIREQGHELPDTHKVRIPVLQQAVANSDGVTRDELKRICEEGIGASDPSVEKYVDGVDFDKVGCEGENVSIFISS